MGTLSAAGCRGKAVVTSHRAGTPWGMRRAGGLAPLSRQRSNPLRDNGMPVVAPDSQWEAGEGHEAFKKFRTAR